MKELYEHMYRNTYLIPNFLIQTQDSASKRYVDWIAQFPETIWHFPLFQTLRHLGFILKQRLIQHDIHCITKEHGEFTEKVLNDQKSEPLTDLKIKDYNKELCEKAKKFLDIKQHQQITQGEVLRFKLYEGFLEGAPQATLQLYIVFQTGHIEWSQIVSISISFLAFTYSATELFLSFPTKVFAQFGVSSVRL